MDKKQYTASFIFNSQLSKVLLIQKNRPEWQAGKLNGVGGKLEPNEDIRDGISREVWEESGITISADKWIHMADLSGEHWAVSFFTYRLESEMIEVESKTDEKVDWYPVDNIPENVIDNLKWLIPMAVYALTEKDFSFANVEYNS